MCSVRDSSTAPCPEARAFVRAVVHDLAGPLRAVQGFAELLMRSASKRLTSEEAEWLERCVEGAARVQGLLEELGLYELEGGPRPLRPVAVSAVLEEVLQGLPQELSAVVQVRHPLPVVLAHPVVVRRVLDNLVRNALKFVAPGSAPKVRVWAEPCRQGWWIFVDDEGIGVPPEDRGRIFEPFVRLHGPAGYPGSGLGLYLVREALEQVGGRIEVEAAPGGGTRFRVELPSPGDGA